MLPDLGLYLSIGAVAGTAAGLLGVGGGIVIVPALTWVLATRGLAPEQVGQVAVGTSLATILPTSLSSIWAHHQRGAVLWPYVARLTPGILAGSVLGAKVALALPSAWLQSAFGVFALIASARMLRAALRTEPIRDGHTSSAPRFLAPAGLGIGTFSSFFGIGGGTLTVPLLRAFDVGIRSAVGTSAACGLPIALAGATTFTFATPTPPIHGAVGYVLGTAWLGVALASIVTARLGAALAHRISRNRLQALFACLLAIAAVKMLLR